MPDHAARRSLAEFIRTHQREILDEWEKRARQLSPARKLGTQTLRDHLPDVIAQISAMAEALDGEWPLPTADAQLHAVERLEAGYDLSDVVREYSLLRETMLDASERGGVPGLDDLRALNRVLDHATEVAVTRYAQASQRLLRALDRISTESLGADGLVALLVRLCKVMMEASPSVDEVTILLVDDDRRLHVKAAVGLLEGREEGFSLAIGEGFSGTVFAERKPRLIRDASRDPLVVSDAIRQVGLRALYGVPLVDGETIGVAHIGSRSAYEFADEDMLLFRAMANRACAFIVEARLRDAERRVRAELEAVFESIPDGVYVGDGRGIRRVNSMGLELTGVRSLEELNRPVDELNRLIGVRDPATGERRRTEDLPFSRALKGETVEQESALTLAGSGEEIVVRSVAAPVRVGGDIVGAVAVNTDITARKRVERELELEAQYRERFVSILGHDLRTPVTAIGMAATLLLRQSGLPERVTRMIRRILSSTERIEIMIRDLLDFSRARAGGLPLEPVGMDLYPVTHAIVDELALANPEREIELRARGDTHGVWDRARLGQVVSNLVSNALHYSPAGTPVLVELAGEKSEVELSVSNQGEPIPPTVMPHLFEPFRRGAVSDVRHEVGLGLGLFIVRSIVEAHRGSISVRSTGERTVFRVRLPRA